MRLFFTLLLCFSLPILYEAALKAYVGRQVVFIMGEMGGGTGFHVNGVVITNNHVCAEKDALGMLLVDGVPRQVLKESPDTDLCMITGIHGGGLRLAVDPKPDDMVTTIGHPLLLPLVKSRGVVLKEVGGYTYTGGTCSAPYKFKIHHKCFVATRYFETTMQVFSGSSGSPVVDMFGRVVGVVMIKNEADWAGIIPVSDLKVFLAK